MFRLLGLPITNDVMWKIEQLKFMLENAFFTNASEKYHISHELAGEFQLDIVNNYYLKKKILFDLIYL